MSTENQNSKSVIVVTIITTIGVLGGALFTNWDKVFKNSPSTASTSSSTPSSPSTSVPVQPEVANIPLGKWSGVAKETSGTSFLINIEINQDCRLNQKCGYISAPEVPCYGEISFVSIKSKYYEFDVSNFDARSDPNICKPGAGELFLLLPDGKLAYKATYSNAEGILARVK